MAKGITQLKDYCDAIYEDTIQRLNQCLLIAKDCLHSYENAGTSLKLENSLCNLLQSTSNDNHRVKSGYEEKNSATNYNDLSNRNDENNVQIVGYENENQMADIMGLITKELSEPYSIYTFRYFIHDWPRLCLLALDIRKNEYVGAIVCKLEKNRENRRKGYIAMLAVNESHRQLGIGTRLVQNAISNMREIGCDEVILETEVTNTKAIRLYTNLGFIREKRLFRYYLNGGDAFRLKLFFTSPATIVDPTFHMSNRES